MEQKKFMTIGVGSPIVDALAQVEESFLEKEVSGAKGGMELADAATIASLAEKAGDDVFLAPGGSAGNTIYGMAELGNTTTFLGKIGNCEAAGFFKDAFVSMGGDTSRLKVADIPNGRCISLVTPDSERTMRTDLGAAATLSPDEVTVEDFKDCRHAHIEGYLLFNKDLMTKVLDSAKEAGCTISLDLASFEVVQACKDDLLSILKDYVTIVFANEQEASVLLDMAEDFEGMAHKLAEICEIGVVKVGPDGAFISSKANVTKVPAVKVDAIDTTGAGDLWAAGFLHGWLHGRPHADNGYYGALLSSEVVKVMGAAIPSARWDYIRDQIK